MLLKQEKRHRRHRRVRSRIKGTNRVPRLCVFRANRHIYAQLVDDEKGRTILSSSDIEIKNAVARAGKIKSNPKSEISKKEEKEIIRQGKTGKAYEVGRLIAEKAKAKKITKVVFDRAGYKYHGRVKALAQGAREGGLRF